ncbi:methyltransferase domain-containing protein, partial [Vibrio sp. M260118]|uniref:methyltransferase domain-containing protein n=1 Tax=Vibrio sp. M260118 TaxID=3020896 RepID=UPI002F40B458
MNVIEKTLKSIYHETGYYKKKLSRINEEKKLRSDAESKYNLEMVDKYFGGKTVVQNGPFSGIEYISSSSGSALLPKLLGSYEEPINDWIEEVIASKYDAILDVGCAEGYYAVGFATRMPSSYIYAYDINSTAIEKAKSLAKVNNVKNISFSNECDWFELNKRVSSTRNILLFCDIEGAEKELLDIEKCESLKYIDIILESHDCFIPG